MNQAATFQATRPIIPAGTQLNGIYEIDEPIAAGGMGEVYKGHAIQTGDLVAIKLIRPDLAEAQAAFALFRKEASALHNLYHEAIVRYYVFTVDPVLERPYLAMEFVDGQSLSAMLRGGPLAFEAVYRLMQRVASGLRAAHERGIVHRDVSPDNIIIPSGDMARAKIIDFGIARSTRLDDEGTVIGTGFAGKYNYVSPEQLGLFGGDVTPKSDIYSLGLVLAEALLGTPIDMSGNPVEVIDKRRKVPDVSAIDHRLRPLIERMLQPDPADRPASMAEVASYVFEPQRSGIPERQRPRAARKTTEPSIRIGRWAALLAGGSAMLAIAAVGIVTLDRPAPPRTEPERPTPSLEPSPFKSGLGPMDWAKLDLEPLPHSETGRAAGGMPTDRGENESIARFVSDFDGGDCYFARPVTIRDRTVSIEGFGRSTAPFRALDDAFLREKAFEADIGVRKVTQGQCPAITFLRELRNTSAPGVTLDLAARSFKVGQPLTGKVSGLGGREVNVLLVSDDGAVRVLPTLRLGLGDDALSFSLPTGAELGTGTLKLVVAVASPKALASLRDTKPSNAGKVFAQALEEAKRTNQPIAVAAHAVKVEK